MEPTNVCAIIVAGRGFIWRVRPNELASRQTMCVFCERGDNLQNRTFYEKGDWFAFLAAPEYALGHAILARVTGAACPTTLTPQNLKGAELALVDVLQAIRSHYRPKDVLIASLRGEEPHMHWHLIPLWEEPEREWRLESKHESGHLFELWRTLIERLIRKHSMSESRWGGPPRSSGRTRLTPGRLISWLCQDLSTVGLTSKWSCRAPSAPPDGTHG